MRNNYQAQFVEQLSPLMPAGGMSPKRWLMALSDEITTTFALVDT
jgi:hypothetical protein